MVYPQFTTITPQFTTIFPRFYFYYLLVLFLWFIQPTIITHFTTKFPHSTTVRVFLKKGFETGFPCENLLEMKNDTFLVIFQISMLFVFFFRFQNYYILIKKVLFEQHHNLKKKNFKRGKPKNGKMKKKSSPTPIIFHF